MRMRSRCLIMLGLGAAVTALPAQATVKDGVDAWQAGDYAKAIANWRKPADDGDADAQFNLGQAYKLGRGVPADSKTAQSWYLKAAQQGHEQAQANLGLMMFQGGDRQGAIPWIIKAAQNGEPRAEYVLGTAMFNGDLVPRDWPRAYALMTRAAAAGLPQASTSLQQMDKYISASDRQAGAAMAADMERGGSFTIASAPSISSTLPPTSASSKASASKPKPAVSSTAPASTPRPTVAAAPPLPPKPAAPPVKTATAVPKPAPATPASTAPMPKAEIASAPAAGKNWLVQIGAYGSQAAAQKVWNDVAKTAAAQGKSPAYIAVGALTRLRAGPFGGKAEANQACQSLQKSGFNCFPVAP